MTTIDTKLKHSSISW